MFHMKMPMGPGTLSPGTGDYNNSNMNMNMSMDNNNNNNMNMNMKMPMMHTSFFWGKDAIVLFSGWPNHSLPVYILACFFVLFMAASVEALTSLAKLRTSSPAVEACVYAVRMAIAYMVMLSVMSFNVGVFFAAVLGHSLGFFLAKLWANRVALVETRETNGDAKI